MNPTKSVYVVVDTTNSKHDQCRAASFDPDRAKDYGKALGLESFVIEHVEIDPIIFKITTNLWRMYASDGAIQEVSRVPYHEITSELRIAIGLSGDGMVEINPRFYIACDTMEEATQRYRKLLDEN